MGVEERWAGGGRWGQGIRCWGASSKLRIGAIEVESLSPGEKGSAERGKEMKWGGGVEGCCREGDMSTARRGKEKKLV